jgi:hypothetical protein
LSHPSCPAHRPFPVPAHSHHYGIAGSPFQDMTSEVLFICYECDVPLRFLCKNRDLAGLRRHHIFLAEWTHYFTERGPEETIGITPRPIIQIRSATSAEQRSVEWSKMLDRPPREVEISDPRWFRCARDISHRGVDVSDRRLVSPTRIGGSGRRPFAGDR